MAVANRVGFEGLELVVDWRIETYDIPHLKTLIQRHGLPILAIHGPFINSMAIQGWPTCPIARLKRTVALAEAVGAGLVVVHPPDRWIRFQGQIRLPSKIHKISIPMPLVGWGAWGRWLWHELAQFQQETSVMITVENLPCRWLGPFRLEPHHFFTTEQLNHFSHLTLDTTHVGTRRVDLLAFYQHLRAKVRHVHLSNFNGQEHQLLEAGCLPLAEFLKRLGHDNYHGMISLELNALSLQAHVQDLLEQTLKQAVNFVQQHLN